jgi:hypothetical protein
MMAKDFLGGSKLYDKPKEDGWGLLKDLKDMLLQGVEFCFPMSKLDGGLC